MSYTSVSPNKQHQTPAKRLKRKVKAVVELDDFEEINATEGSDWDIFMMSL